MTRHLRQNRPANRSKKRTTSRRLLRGPETLEARALLAVLVADALSGTADTTIGGTVYEDLNSNGAVDLGENGLEGWKVYLDLDFSGTWNTDAAGVQEPAVDTNRDGDFLIRNLAVGSYRVAELVPAGWVPTSPISRDVAVSKGRDSQALFLDFAGGVIAGTVWNDLDQDGIRAVDPSTSGVIEPGLAGWTVYLDLDKSRGLDPGEPTTVTASDGSYQFVEVPPGEYEVTEILPTGWEVAPGYDNKQTAMVVALGRFELDFANFSTTNGAIQGTVWNDANADGVRAVDPDTGSYLEPGLADWTVFLDLDGNQSLDVGEPSTLTNLQGEYLFLGLDAGDYEVTQVLPTGWDVAPGWDLARTATVRGGETELGVDFANITTLNGSIRGTVWNDLGRNGVRDVNVLTGAFLDPPLPNWTVYLDRNRNRLFDAGEPSTLTDVDGGYTFADLQVGEYQVREILPTGWETAPTFDDNQSVKVFSGTESIARDFANYDASAAAPGSVGGTVWNDLDGNGLRDTSETGLAGWTVFLDQNSDGLRTAGEPTATTGADGAYLLTSVSPGTVRFVVESMPGWRPTAPLTATHTVSLRSGQDLRGLDFGQRQPTDSSIHGVVFADSDHDHLRDSGERGLSGITVYLDLNANGSLDAGEPETHTSADQFYTPGVDESGTYSFTHLSKGTYTVRKIVPDTLSATPHSELEHTVTLETGEDRSVDSAAVFRPNEIHGTKYEDVNGNHTRDAGEPGLAGVTLFIDANRNQSLDPGERSTTSLADGSYVFQDLQPGAYVIREVVTPGWTQTAPTTVGGTLWPTGTSHGAVGIVTPLSITASLAEGEVHREAVSLTLPNTGALTNLVDVFLLFDDTGSFVNNSPIVRAAFPNIISNLQTALPGIDLGFGVGRLEEYANFAWEYSSGRPFVLNQPIVAASTPGYLSAIQAALDRTTPGYGGDQPETDIEALYQLVTGVGFDGNNNGSVLDSGPAGLASTQLTPGNSGDVPSFASFTADPAHNVLPGSGSIGGGGFRSGALPIVLLATDTGIAYQPKGEMAITGVGGLSVPVSELTQTSRASTPFNSGAGIQETVTALNALGALVIGLGTNPEAAIDPRQVLESLSRLTGATNRTAATISNGTPDPIAPGDPFYFQIASGFGASVANGVVSAIQNAVTNVAVDVTVQASDPRVRIINHTGTVLNVGSGATATFDIEFVGDGVPRRFDLQFVRAGSNVVLGSIPVVLGTPIAGDGYAFDELEDGEISSDIEFGNQASIGAFVNQAPSFERGPNQAVPEDAAPQVVAGWATNISPGPVGEAGQVVDFIVSNSNPGLFSSPPAVSPTGTLTYTLSPNAHGVAVVAVQIHDNGGTANGGQDTSAVQTFSISVSAVNDVPVAVGDSYSTVEDTTLTVAATGVLGNDTDVDGDVLSATLVAGPAHGSLTLNADGSFVYTPAANYSGLDQFTYRANDGAVDSNEVVVALNITSVNDAPVAVGDSYSTAEDTALTVAAPGLLGNDTDVDGDVLSATLVAGPAHGSLTLNADGSFVYTPAANYSGQDQFTYRANDGLADSNDVVVTLNVTPVNDAPVAVADFYSVAQGSPLHVASVAGLLMNDRDVDGDRLFVATTTPPSHGSLQVNADGSLTYIPNASFAGDDLFTYQVSDGALTSTATVTIRVLPVSSSDPQLMVVDDKARSTFGYEADGDWVASKGLHRENQTPRGLATNSDGSFRWVVDAKGEVFVYNAAGNRVGRWEFEGIDKPEGIATNGVDLWIVDREKASVFFFAKGANLRAGSVKPTSSFRLAKGDRNPMDIATDGNHLWVVNDASIDQVFRYSLQGQLEGVWQIDRLNSAPTGLAVGSGDTADIWIVDAGSDRLFQYTNAASRVDGQQAAATSLPLVSQNRNPQGVALAQPPSRPLVMAAMAPPTNEMRGQTTTTPSWSRLVDEVFSGSRTTKHPESRGRSETTSTTPVREKSSRSNQNAHWDAALLQLTDDLGTSGPRKAKSIRVLGHR